MSTADRTILGDERRLQALREAELLDTRAEEPFDAITRLVQRTLDVPVVLVTAVTPDRQVFKSSIGLPEPWAGLRETPIGYSYCQYVVLAGEPLVVEDAREHPLLRDNPALEALRVVAYAGVPVTTGDGRRLGALAAVDTEPRRWREQDIWTLRQLAELVRTEVDARLLAHAYRDELRELHQREEAVRALTEHAPDVIARYDRRLRHLYINPAVEHLIGVTPDALLGRSLDESGMPPEQVAVWRRCAQRVFDTGREERIELEYRTPRGTLVGSTRLVPEFDPEGRVEYVLAVTRDITRERRLEAEVSLAHRLEAVAHLAGGVAHDYNNLLTSILGNAELLLQDLPPGSPLRDQAHDIESSARRAAARTRQLLAFSQRLVLTPRVLDLNEVIRASLGMLSHAAGRNARVLLDLGRDVDRVRVDPAQLRQVLLDLVLNASQAIAHEHGRIVIATRNREVTEQDRGRHFFLVPGAYVELRVADNGAGIPAEALPRVFEPFYSTRGPGTGLGLATVYGSIKQSGGYVLVESTPGTGTTFEILLPSVHGES